MAKPKRANLPAHIRGQGKVCLLCWKPADSRERTNNGYHIECAKDAAAIIAAALHSKKGIVYAEWYRKRYPGRPVPGIDLQQQLGDGRE